MVQLFDLSLGGFAILSAQAFQRGVIHWFTFTADTGRTFQVLARAVHTFELMVGMDQFISGWEFVESNPYVLIHQFVEAVTMIGIRG